MMRIILFKWGLILLVVLISLSSLLTAQDLQKLEKEKETLLQEIKLTNQLLSSSKEKEQVSLSRMEALSAQVRRRKSLLENSLSIQKATRQKVTSLKVEMKKLSVEYDKNLNAYAGILNSSYRMSLVQNKWLFLLSAASLNQAWKRLQYLKRVNSARKKHLEVLKSTLAQMDSNKSQLELTLQKQKELALEHERLTKELEAESKREQVSLEKHKKDSEKLKDELGELRNQREKLNKEIAALINAELGSRDKNIPMTPAMKALATSFQKNKGALPWPVKKAIISRNFGIQKHPTLKNVSISNNGIDLQTTENAAVHTVFEGKVVGVQAIPGMGTTIIIRHGIFYSVYAYLQNPVVAKDDVLETGQMIAEARQNPRSGIFEVHFEIWQEKALQDPAIWLSH